MCLIYYICNPLSLFIEIVAEHFCIPGIKLITIWLKNECHSNKGNETSTSIVNLSSKTYGPS